MQAYKERLVVAVPGAEVVSSWHEHDCYEPVPLSVFLLGDDQRFILKAEEHTDNPGQGWVHGQRGLGDLARADVLVFFGGERGQGGNHVEFGWALAQGLRLVVIGYRDSVYQCAPQVEFHRNFKSWLAGEKLRQSVTEGDQG